VNEETKPTQQVARARGASIGVSGRTLSLKISAGGTTPSSKR
jgi:hypothetical protein